MRTHHRGYFLVWDLFDLWRSALRSLAPEQLPTPATASTREALAP
jgi:hypothetical protein